MTAQVPESIQYHGQAYSIAGKNGTGLFDPTQHGVQPVGRCTACWRGYYCSYSVDEQRLLLVALRLNADQPAPTLFGVHPKPQMRSFRGHEFRVWDAVYEPLRHAVPYTGGLLLARDFIQESYVHMGFHPAWKYREVHELVFRDGELEHAMDRSGQIAELRRERSNRPLEPGSLAAAAEMERWVEMCFNQEYEW
jgi:hypothetical protein